MSFNFISLNDMIIMHDKHDNAKESMLWSTFFLFLFLSATATESQRPPSPTTFCFIWLLLPFLNFFWACYLIDYVTIPVRMLSCTWPSLPLVLLPKGCPQFAYHGLTQFNSIWFWFDFHPLWYCTFNRSTKDPLY